MLIVTLEEKALRAQSRRRTAGAAAPTQCGVGPEGGPPSPEWRARAPRLLGKLFISGGCPETPPVIVATDRKPAGGGAPLSAALCEWPMLRHPLR